METPCWCPSKGHQHGGRKVAKTSVIEFYHYNEKMIPLERRYIENSISSIGRTVQLAKRER